MLFAPGLLARGLVAAVRSRDITLMAGPVSTYAACVWFDAGAVLITKVRQVILRFSETRYGVWRGGRSHY